MTDDRDAYGNRLAKGTRRQVAKERALYRRIARELQAATKQGSEKA